MDAPSGTTPLLLTRHGLSEHNLRTHLYMGRSPEARLLPQGRAQARRLAQRLAAGGGVAHIVCSSLPRTVQTAEAIAETLGVASVHGEDAFWELSKGTWEGTMPRTNLPTHLQRALDADPFGYRYPQGESYADVVARVGPAFERWAARWPGARVLFVLHGDVLRALLYHLLRFAPEKIGDIETAPCALSEVWREPGASGAPARYRLVRLNDASHLED